MFLKYNLQFFAEEGEEGNVSNNTGDNNTGDNNNEDGIDPQAFAEIISDKDKKIEQLEKDIADLKKSNANLIVKVNAATNPPAQKKTFEENLLSMVGAKPRKE